MIKDFRKLVPASEKWKTSVEAAKERRDTEEPKITYIGSKDMNQLSTEETHTHIHTHKMCGNT